MVRVVSFSEAGGHRINEDAVDVRRHPADPECWLCCLADGQGGRAGGVRAARLACDIALATATRLPPHQLAGLTAWPSILRQADEAVSHDSEAGFTTLIGLSVARDAVCGASCGDSAALAVSEGGRVRDLTAGQSKNPPVGSGTAAFVPFWAALVRPWRVVVMSDGVWKYVGREQVQRFAVELADQPLVDALQRAARLPGSGRFQDDFTVAVLGESV